MELRHVAQRAGRLSSFLKGEMKMSTGLMNKLKWGDAITVNGQPEHTDFAVSIGDKIAVRLDEPTPEYPAEDAPLTILYEDEHVLMINKPVGMLSQKAEAKDESLVEHIITYMLDTKQLTEAELHKFKPSICNRLDRNTSGLVVAGKSLIGLQKMGELFKNRTMKKFYRH